MWVVSIENFLNRFGIPSEQHVHVSSHQICGDAYCWVELNRGIIARWNWSQFVHALCAEVDRSKNIAETRIEEHKLVSEEMLACTPDLDPSSAKSIEEENEFLEEKDCKIDSSVVSVVSGSFKEGEIDALVEEFYKPANLEDNEKVDEINDHVGKFYAVAVMDEPLASTEVDISDSMAKNGLMSPYKAMGCSQYGQGNYARQVSNKMLERDDRYSATTEWWKSHVSET